MTPPTVGDWYKARGYTFRVDAVERGEVYYTRWRGRKKQGAGYRMPVADWVEQMTGAGVKRVKSNA